MQLKRRDIHQDKLPPAVVINAVKSSEHAVSESCERSPRRLAVNEYVLLANIIDANPHGVKSVIG